MPIYDNILPNHTNTKPTQGKPLPEASAFEKASTLDVLPSQDDFNSVFNPASKNYLSALSLFEKSSDAIANSFANKNPYNDEATVHSTFFQPSHKFNVQLLINFINALRNDEKVAAHTKESYVARLKSLVSNLQYTVNPQLRKEVLALERTLHPVAESYITPPLVKRRLIGALNESEKLPALTLSM